ncbi:site-specific DNA-methyltransferase, partial [Candidatus Poribacteria bacterium]|nr:site-specific DNA-methyltransferase [Candidatus Poribacteria bacterium]
MLMIPENSEPKSESTELREKIVALDAELTEDFKAQFVVSPFLSRKIVSFQGNKDKPAYSWYKYKEAFSAGLVEYFLCSYAGRMSGKVLDPFAGIGTTLFAASVQGISADGIELLPIGQEIIHTRLLAEREMTSDDIATLEHWVTDLPWKESSENVPFSSIRITENAYPEETVAAIERYRGALQQENSKVQAILRLALLCVLESISYTRKDGQYLRWDARSGRRRPGTKAFNKGEILTFDAAITAKLKEILSDIRDIETPLTLFPDRRTQKDIRLFKGSCLEILPTLEAATYGAVMTSPPYCNRYDYTRTYALELAMLGLTQAEVSNLRQEMLSCTVENREKDLLKICPQWTPFIEAADQQKLLQAIYAYLEHEKASGNLNNTSIPRMIRGYFSEMACVIGECARIL